MARLKEYYNTTVVKKLTDQFSYKSVMEVPKITKITLNMGLGDAIGDKKIIEYASGDMAKIGGQKPVVTLSRKSIAGFKVRDGWPIGCKVTLRREKMYEFMDRLISIAIPRINVTFQPPQDNRWSQPPNFNRNDNNSKRVVPKGQNENERLQRQGETPESKHRLHRNNPRIQQDQALEVSRNHVDTVQVL